MADDEETVPRTKDDEEEETEEEEADGEKSVAGQIEEYPYSEEEKSDEEFMGEGLLVPPPPMDELQESIKSEEKIEAEEMKEIETVEEAVPIPLEKEEPEAEPEPDVLSLDEEESLSKLVPSVSEIEQRISPPLLIKPREMTRSEVEFEQEHREVIEEEMRRIVHPTSVTEVEVIEERRPVEKKHISMTEVDVTGLYGPPKALESEVSFISDEDEADKEKVQETTEEITESVIDAVQVGVKHDADSIFATHDENAIAEVRKCVEEIVEAVRRGEDFNIPLTINETLGHIKINLRNVLIVRLREKLGKYEKFIEEPEGEEEEEELEEEEEPEIQMEGEKRRYTKARELVPELKPEHFEMIEGKVAKEIVGKIKKIARMHKKRRKGIGEEEVEEEEEEEDEERIYDWKQLLTESEMRIKVDAAMRKEMDQYVVQRRTELEAERRRKHTDKRTRERSYSSDDPEVRLANLNLTVTMKFVINTGNIFTCAYRFFLPFKNIKEDLSVIFKVPPDVLLIYRDDVEVLDYQTAHDLRPEIEPLDCVAFRLLTIDNDRWPLKSWHLEIPVPDIITCTVETGKDELGNSEYKEVVVEIENRKIRKPFVGGYKDITTGIEYHNAFTQSAPPAPKLSPERLNTRDTQTAFTRKKKVDTTCHKATQMWRPDCFIDTDNDRILTAQPYKDYETWSRQRDVEGKVRVIQRYLRAMILRKYVKKLSQEYRARKAWEEEQEKKRTFERENRIKHDIVNMTYPKTKADFDMLYSMVERWRKAQVDRISKLKTEAPRKAEFCSVLEKEIKLLEAIEVHRIAILKEQKRRRNMNFMEKVSKPITWTGYRGMTVKMDTLKTQRARELKELYQGLARDDLSPEDRIEVLMSLKYALKVHNTRLTNELTDLLTRECDLLIRGVGVKSLEYLRRRIEHLFMLYFKEPDFNPEVAKYDPDYNRDPYKQNILFCKLCHNMKLYKEFSVNARDTIVNVCESCRWIHNIAVPRIDLNPYRYMLRTVRRDEQKRNCYSSCAFILQEEDMRFLVENIWHNRSALSESGNLLDLRMPRWEAEKDWTPWNCILLTELEAKAHLKSTPAINYEKQLIGEIISKHELAKRHFQQLFASDIRIRDSGKWTNVVDVKEYVPPPLAADLWDLTHEECETIKKRGSLYEVHETKRKQEDYTDKST